jgi:NADPH:quinone reductase-like Zn-dependent oxidoreductase
LVVCNYFHFIISSNNTYKQHNTTQLSPTLTFYIYTFHLQTMAHLAAVQPAPKAPFEVKEIETPQPGPHELLIKNEAIAIQPIDAKIARVAMLPIPYPAILGSSFAGTVTAVGPEVTGFAVGDKVVAAKTAGATENKNSAFQRYVISSAVTTTKLPSDASLDTAVRLVGNLATVPALFNATLKLARPDPSAPAKPQGKKILVYGGTSSIGSLSIQYLKQAGYDIVTTTSPRHEAFVSRLGASKVIDHTQDSENTVKELVSAGPYDVVVDNISTAQTVKLLADVLAAQGGGNVYALQPPFAPETLPDGVSRIFEGWSLLLAKEEHAELLKWTFATYFPQALAKDSLIAVPPRKISGGLAGLDNALDILIKGVSSEKLVVDPWE